MGNYAEQYQKQNRGKGTVSNVTSYCFTFTSLPDKKGNQTSYVVMKSWFTKLQGKHEKNNKNIT